MEKPYQYLPPVILLATPVNSIGFPLYRGEN